LRVLPVAGDPGYSSPGDIAADLATIFRKRLGPCERLTVASAAMLSLDPDARDTLIQAAERARKAEQVFRRIGRRHRPPPLTPVEQRRADAISFDDTPRETLAAAWAGASERDRRDLVARATGRVDA
jgi:hypothetical protein